jgi:RNA polymerase sigma-70 factor (ECF subfamily)
MRAAPGFRERSAVQTWIFGIAFNVVRHYRRQEARNRLLHRQAPRRAGGERGDPELAAARREQAAILQAALSGLSDELRTVFLLCEMEECTGAEAARILQLSEGTLWSRLRAACKVLRGTLRASPSSPRAAAPTPA